MRDNLGRSEIGAGLNVYSESWWHERVDAVSRAVAAVFAAPAAQPLEQPITGENAEKQEAEWVPFWGAPVGNLSLSSAKLSLWNGRGERI